MRTPFPTPIRPSAAAILLTAAALLGPVSAGSRSQPESAESDASRAATLHARGVAERDRAMQLEQRLAGVESESDREDLEKEIGKAYRAAAKDFRAAASSDPQMFQAFADLGEVLNRRADGRGALEALEQALALVPDDPAVMFHRGEAYLALDRVEDAKRSFGDLFDADPGRAESLLLSMKQWVIGKRQDPGRTPAETAASLEDWIEELEAAAAQDTEQP